MVDGLEREWTLDHIREMWWTFVFRVWNRQRQTHAMACKHGKTDVKR